MLGWLAWVANHVARLAETTSAVEAEASIRGYQITSAAAARWDLRVFANIAESETRHAAALTQLAATADLLLVAGVILPNPRIDATSHTRS